MYLLNIKNLNIESAIEVIEKIELNFNAESVTIRKKNQIFLSQNAFDCITLGETV
jgi:hypothetical protein